MITLSSVCNWNSKSCRFRREISCSYDWLMVAIARHCCCAMPSDSFSFITSAVKPSFSACHRRRLASWVSLGIPSVCVSSNEASKHGAMYHRNTHVHVRTYGMQLLNRCSRLSSRHWAQGVSSMHRRPYSESHSSTETD